MAIMGYQCHTSFPYGSGTIEDSQRKIVRTSDGENLKKQCLLDIIAVLHSQTNESRVVYRRSVQHQASTFSNMEKGMSH